MMAEGRQKDEWRHTAHILALTANCHETKKGKVHRVEDFMPRFGPKPKPLKGSILDLKKIFVKDK